MCEVKSHQSCSYCCLSLSNRVVSEHQHTGRPLELLSHEMNRKTTTKNASFFNFVFSSPKICVLTIKEGIHVLLIPWNRALPEKPSSQPHGQKFAACYGTQIFGNVSLLTIYRHWSLS